ncbi:hypothetical protein FQZ97_769800 [compost metagenome]
MSKSRIGTAVDALAFNARVRNSRASACALRAAFAKKIDAKDSSTAAPIRNASRLVSGMDLHSQLQCKPEFFLRAEFRIKPRPSDL